MTDKITIENKEDWWNEKIGFNNTRKQFYNALRLKKTKIEADKILDDTLNFTPKPVIKPVIEDKTDEYAGEFKEVTVIKTILRN